MARVVARIRGLAVPPGGTTGLPGNIWAGGTAPAPRLGGPGGNGGRRGPAGEVSVLNGALGPLAGPFASDGMGLTAVGTVGGPVTERLVGLRPLVPRGADAPGDIPCVTASPRAALGTEATGEGGPLGVAGGVDAAAVGLVRGFSGGRNSRTGGRSGVPLPTIRSEGCEMIGLRGWTPVVSDFGEAVGLASQVPLGWELTVGAELGVGGGSPFACKRFRIASAAVASTELECVFFCSIPTRGRISIIAPALTSNSRASSLIRIFCALSPKTDLTP